MDAPVSRTGLLGDAINSIIERYRIVKKQSVAYRQLIPQRARELLVSTSHSNSLQCPHERLKGDGVAQEPPQGDWAFSHTWWHDNAPVSILI